MVEISKEINIEILEKLADGTYKKKNPSTRAELVKETPEKSFVSDSEKAEIAKVKDKADKAYLDDKVKTNVPIDAEFTDTTYTAGESVVINGTVISIEGETITEGNIPPEGIEEGRLWIDTSEDALEGSIFEELRANKADKTYVDEKIENFGYRNIDGGKAPSKYAGFPPIIGGNAHGS